MANTLTLNHGTDDDRPEQCAVCVQFDCRGSDYSAAVFRHDHRLEMSLHLVQWKTRRFEEPPHGRQIRFLCRMDRHGSVTARGAQQDPPVDVGRTYISPKAR